MLIRNLRTNRINNPLGFALDRPALSWIIDETDAQVLIWTQIEISKSADFSQLLFDSGRLPEVDRICYRPGDQARLDDSLFLARCRASGDNGETAVSETAWFETGRMDLPWQGQWITPDLDPVSAADNEDNVYYCRPADCRAALHLRPRCLRSLA